MNIEYFNCTWSVAVSGNLVLLHNKEPIIEMEMTRDQMLSLAKILTEAASKR